MVQHNFELGSVFVAMNQNLGDLVIAAPPAAAARTGGRRRTTRRYKGGDDPEKTYWQRNKPDNEGHPMTYLGKMFPTTRSAQGYTVFYFENGSLTSNGRDGLKGQIIEGPPSPSPEWWASLPEMEAKLNAAKNHPFVPTRSGGRRKNRKTTRKNRKASRKNRRNNY
jgi:hypothetical protein